MIKYNIEIKARDIFGDNVAMEFLKFKKILIRLVWDGLRACNKLVPGEDRTDIEIAIYEVDLNKIINDLIKSRQIVLNREASIIRLSSRASFSIFIEKD